MYEQENSHSRDVQESSLTELCYLAVNEHSVLEGVDYTDATRKEIPRNHWLHTSVARDRMLFNMARLVHSQDGTNVTVFTFMSEFDSTWKGRRVLEVSVLAVIFVAAVVGNVLVLLVIGRQTSPRGAGHVTMANLACADLLLASGIPFIAVTRAATVWVFGNVMCKVVAYLQFIAGTSIILTLVLISVERYLHVRCFPPRRMSDRLAGWILAGSWVIAMVAHLPIVISQAEMRIELDRVDHVYCGVEWPSGFHRDIYLTAIAVFFFCIPLVVVAVFYYKIFRIVQKSEKRSELNTSVTGSKLQIRLIKMSLSVVLLFVLMWLPFYVIGFVGVYTQAISSSNFMITVIIAMSNSCQNPITYGYFNRRFRDEFRALYFSRACTHGQRQDPEPEKKETQHNDRVGGKHEV